MHTKVRIGKGANVILVASMIGMGAFLYIPTAYAAENQQSVTASSTENQQTAALSKLEIDGVQLNRPFSSDVHTYFATVPSTVQQISMLLDSNDPQASITVNGNAFKNGNSQLYDLQTSGKTFTITVNDGSQTPVTYTLMIVTKEEDNFLQDIKLSEGSSPQVDLTDFDFLTTDYNLDVKNEIDAITVTPEAVESSTSKVTVKSLDTVGNVIPLTAGKTTDIVITVTAANGDQKTYTIHVKRDEAVVLTPVPKPTPVPTKPKPSNPGSKNNTHTGGKKQTGTNNKSKTGSKNKNNSLQNSSAQKKGAALPKISTATLSSLTVSSGTWNETFSSSTYTYHVAVSSDVTTVTINPGAKYSDAAVSINGGSGETVQLDGSKTIVPVIVTRGEDRKTYVLVFDKPVQPTTTIAAATTVTANTTVTSSTSTLDTNSGSDKAYVQTTMWNNGRKNNNTSTSLWSRIVDSISSFFSKLF